MDTARRSRRGAAVTAFAVVASLLMGTALAAATPFADVDPNSVHAPGITYVADAGITSGCEDGSVYCPGDFVRRDQMGTFMHRLSGNAPDVEPSVNAHRLEGFSAAELMVPGPEGPPGVAGIEIVTQSGSVSGVSAHQLEVTCPPDKVVISGGGNVTPASLNWAMERSYPNTTTSWRVLWRQLPGGPASHNATAYAICANAS